MVQIQILSKVLATGNINIIEDNLLTEDYFLGYEKEYEFIQSHYKKYGNVPDEATFLSQFPDIELVEVNESDKYLVDKIREENLYYKAVPVVQRIAELLTNDANDAAEYMLNAIKELQPSYTMQGVDIISNAKDRLQQFKDRKENQDNWFFTSGFPELDDIIHGLQRGEELFVIFARTNQGKTWILEKIVTHIWQLGFNVGYISPEMTANSVGYRFDTLYKNFSNKGLMWSNNNVSEKEYDSYIDELITCKNKFIVGTPADFDRNITVSKLKRFVVEHKLDVLAIDGIKYLRDDRGKRNDNVTTSLTNISEDLMILSVELGIPVLVVVQANRSGSVQEESGTPELESIRDSDGISHNASKVISIRQTKLGLEMGIKKNRYGAVGGKLLYNWNIDTGDFMFIPTYDDAEPQEVTERKVEKVKEMYNDERDVF